MTDSAILTVNGWTILVHPLFTEQLELLALEVEKSRRKHPKDYLRKNAAKRLGAILHIAFEKIPSDPTSSVYRQGDTLGDEYKHWFRDKFFQQYRLFFRYSAVQKIIIYGWVNDDSTKRAYDSKTDAYATFRRMLKAGNPPDDWDKLKKVIEEERERREAEGQEEVFEIITRMLREQQRILR